MGKLAFSNNSQQRKRDELEEEITTLVFNTLKFTCLRNNKVEKSLKVVKRSLREKCELKIWSHYQDHSKSRWRVMQKETGQKVEKDSY